MNTTNLVFFGLLFLLTSNGTVNLTQSLLLLTLFTTGVCCCNNNGTNNNNYNFGTNT